MNGSDIKYLVPAEGDQLWGLTVTSVGNQVITSEEEYPPQNHPKGYFLMLKRGVCSTSFNCCILPMVRA